MNIIFYTYEDFPVNTWASYVFQNEHNKRAFAELGFFPAHADFNGNQFIYPSV